MSQPELSRTHTTANPAGRRIRHILGDDGREWIVGEHPVAPATDARATCLVFQSAGIARRVKRFPSDWYLYSEAELYRLSLRD